jgi:hypothetical protein
VITLYAYKNYVSDKKSFGFDGSGARVGETPNLCFDAGSEANARLIASAPELLDALEHMTEQLKAWNGIDNDCDVILAAEKAIAKAKEI